MFTPFIPNLFPIYAQFMPNLKALSIFKFELDMLLFFIFMRGFYAKIPCIHFLLIKNIGEIFKNKNTFLVKFHIFKISKVSYLRYIVVFAWRVT